jgi:hypothetical protein
MVKSRCRPEMVFCFAWRHFQTDGKLENMCGALENVDGNRLGLSIFTVCLDGEMPNNNVVEERLARAKKVLGKLRRRGYRGELILPGPMAATVCDEKYKKYLKGVYKKAAATGAKVIWLDDRGADVNRRWTRVRLMSWFAAIRQSVHKSNPKVQLGLIGAELDCYLAAGTSPAEIAHMLADGTGGLLGQAEQFTDDYKRTSILDVARSLAVSATLSHKQNKVRHMGSVSHGAAGNFHKSAEATQMQINLNVLYGRKQILLDCFDSTGMAPGNDNIYVQMAANNQRFLKKLCQYVPDRPEHQGITIIIPDAGVRGAGGAAEDSGCWAEVLWRMGLPVKFVSAKQVAHESQADDLYVLSGTVARQLSRRQLNHVFRSGVLLDARAAETIQKMKLPGLIGTKVGPAIKNVQTEILSDQSFATCYYGHQTVWSGRGQAGDFRQLTPFHNQCRVVTTLLRKGHLPNINGMVLFDNVKHNHRCAILPYNVNAANCEAILNTERQRHLRDVLLWLLRRRLGCFIENTPDLIPFYVVMPGARRIVLALLNVGFDWAIDARVRLGQTPFKIKRVRELNEQGQLGTPGHLQLKIYRGYQYIELCSETAVPPMQMVVLLLEG